MEILKLKNLNKVYKHESGDVHAVKDVNLTVNKGEIIGIVGTSGSGKSSLLHLIGALDNPSSGDVVIDNLNLFEKNESERTIYRRRNIGFIFQDFNLVPLLTAYENVVLPLELDGVAVDTEYINQLFKILNIEDRKNHLPSTLSGGEKQRVAIARALCTNPNIVLADEPTGSLDSKTSEDVLDLLKYSIKKFNQTLILITHDDHVASIADRVIRIEDGHVIEGTQYHE